MYIGKSSSSEPTGFLSVALLLVESSVTDRKPMGSNDGKSSENYFICNFMYMKKIEDDFIKLFIRPNTTV